MQLIKKELFLFGKALFIEVIYIIIPHVKAEKIIKKLHLIH